MATELQTKISKLQEELSKLENDSNYLNAKQAFALTLVQYGANNYWNSDGYFCWVSSDGNTWCDAQSDFQFKRNRGIIDAQEVLISNKKGELAPLVAQQTKIDVAASSAGASAQGKKDTTKWIFFGLIALIIVGAAVWMLFKMPQVKKWYVIGGGFGLLLAAYLIFFGTGKK